MTSFEEIVGRLQAVDPTFTEAQIQAEIDWLIEQGYVARIPEAWDDEIGAWSRCTERRSVSTR